MHLDCAADDPFSAFVDAIEPCVFVSLWLNHLCSPLTPCRLPEQHQRGVSLFSWNEWKGPEDVFELLCAQLVKPRDRGIQAREGVGIRPSREQPRETGDLPACGGRRRDR